jgi:hypothetical protein
MGEFMRNSSHVVCSRTIQVFFLCLIHFTFALEVRSQPSGGSPSGGSYVAAFRTPKHVTLSKPEVFHDAVEEVVQYLQENKVNLVSDPLRARIETQDPISVESLVRIAKDAGASYLLYITVDRPVAQWLKVTVECYDLDEKMLWRNSAGYTGALDANSKKGLPEIMKKLGKQLSVKFGQPGLMLKPNPASPPPVSGENSNQ